MQIRIIDDPRHPTKLNKLSNMDRSVAVGLLCLLLIMWLAVLPHFKVSGKCKWQKKK